MKINIDNYKNLMIVTSSKTICVNLLIKINQSLNHDIKFIISCNESLAEYTMKYKIILLLTKYEHELEISYILRSLLVDHLLKTRKRSRNLNKREIQSIFIKAN